MCVEKEGKKKKREKGAGKEGQGQWRIRRRTFCVG
jgi:hypothetical protein